MPPDATDVWAGGQRKKNRMKPKIKRKVQIAPTYPELGTELTEDELAALPPVAREEALGRDRGLDYALMTLDKLIADKAKSESP